MGYASIFELREELNMWCYAVYSDGLMALITKQTELSSYPQKLIKLIEDYEGRCYPTPLDTTDQDLVWVGRIREDLCDDNGLTLWCCGDQIRKGAASNAVQILKKLIAE